MNNLKKQNNRAITLIALTITILVLIVLATVSIKVMFDSGIISKTEKTVNNYDDKSAEDEIRKAFFSYLSAIEMNPNENVTFESKLRDFGIKYDYITGNDIGGYVVKVTLKGGIEKIYEIAEDGTINNATIKWSQNSEGKITDGKSQIQIGDYVKYEEVLSKPENSVKAEKKQKLINDLAKYSGNTSLENQNTPESINQETSLRWRVLDFKNNKIRLICETPTQSKLEIHGYKGYNNGVLVLDETCDVLYSVNGIGKAKNLKIEDIEDKFDKIKFDYTVDGNSSRTVGYGEEKEYTGSLGSPNTSIYPPNICSKEVGCKAIDGQNTLGYLGLSEQTSFIEGEYSRKTRLKLVNNVWTTSGNISNNFIDSIYYTLFINNGSDYPIYWISSRGTVCGDDKAYFGLRYIVSGIISFRTLAASSYNYVDGYYCGFRPVVTLNADIELEADGTNTWKIK